MLSTPQIRHITDQNDIRVPGDGPQQIAHERDVYHRAFIDDGTARVRSRVTQASSAVFALLLGT